MNQKAELVFLYQFLVYLVLGMGEKNCWKVDFHFRLTNNWP